MLTKMRTYCAFLYLVLFLNPFSASEVQLLNSKKKKKLVALRVFSQSMSLMKEYNASLREETIYSPVLLVSCSVLFKLIKMLSLKQI